MVHHLQQQQQTKAFDFFGKKQNQKAEHNNFYVQEISFSLEEDKSSERNSSEPWIEPIAWQPRAFKIYNLLTDAECDHLISSASSYLDRSTIGDSENPHLNQLRTSSGTFLGRYDDEVVSKIEEKVALLTGIPVPNQEEIQVLRYEKEQKYGQHRDYFPEKILNERDGQQRVATILLYLSDVEHGGETHFPLGQLTQEYREKHEKEFADFSDCGKTPEPTATKPVKGDALLFYSMSPSNSVVDVYSLHQGCPVIRGTKWSATIWMHQGEFRRNNMHMPNEPCEDKEEAACPGWATSGECEKNPGFMRGTCRLSCGLCQKCLPGDVLCERKNFGKG